MDPLYLAYYLALFVSPIVLYILLSKPKKTGKYSKPDWYHFLKTRCATPYVKQYQKYCRNEFTNLPEDEQERPKQNPREYEADSQIIYGVDTKGNYFSLRITLRSSLHAEISIEYRNHEGRIYRLPNEPQVLLCSIVSRQWKASGLHIEVMQPFRRLRITYNGLMRMNHFKNDEGTIEHVKFHFLWNAASSPLYHPRDMDVDLLTDAVSRESWRDGDWINMLGADYGFEQFGALNGFFNADSLKADNMVYMPSWRRRKIGPADPLDLKRDFFIFGLARDGTAFCVGAKSIRMGCTQYRYGSILKNNGQLYSISSNDISLEYLGDNGEIPNIFSLHFVANGNTYKCIPHVNTYKTSLTKSGERRGWLTKIITAECDFNSDQANAVVTFWYSNSGEAFDLPTSLLKPKPVENPDEVLLVQLDSSQCLDHNLTGGKGNSLGMLSYSLKSNRFEVPPGFVITSTSFKHQLREHPQLLKAIGNLEDICYGKTVGDVEAACKTTTDLFANTPIATAISDLIVKEINDMSQSSDGGTWKWAIRSSGLDEDSEELSAAGQNSTVLCCTTQEDILKAVAACWGSLYAFQSVEYRRRHGIAVNAEMAVVVQKMIPAESAGVLFTCHPSTGNPMQMVITSNYGLGESVVSARADPDTIVLSRSEKDKIAILNVEIGSKKTKITSGLSGTQEIINEEELARKLSLSEQQIIRLGKIGVLLEKKFGNPRDIEWAFCNDVLYLLQSRPVTSLGAWSDWELQHEFDTPIFTAKSVYTRANVGEVCKGAMTVLTQSVVVKVMDDGMMVEGYEKPPNPYTTGPTIISSHTIFLDMLNFMYEAVTKELTLQTKMIDLAIFGHIVFDEVLHRTALKRHGIMTRLASLKRFWSLLKKAWNNQAILDQVLRFNNYWEIRFKSGDTPAKMLNKLENQFDNLHKSFRYHVHTSTTSIFYQMIAMSILTENKEFTDEHLADISLLLSTNSSVESAEVPVILERITSNIRSANRAREFVEIKPEDGLHWLEKNCPNVKKVLDQFLSDHGHRLFREFEFKEKTWDMNPEVIISMLQANCTSEVTTRKAQGFTVEETIAKLTSPKSNMTRRILKYFVKKCRESVAAREKTKSELIKAVHRFRLAYIETGRKMVLTGYIPEEDLVFHLRHDELKAIANGKNPGLVSKALRRKRLYDKWDNLQFPELNHGPPIPEQELDKIDFIKDPNGVRLKGTPVYQGDVIARACVITDIKEAKKIQPGDVLITISTDIAWSPYFPMLSGVVTELGGLISHGAVVAREYGLPCIVGVQNATKYFKTGDRVRLSGKIGLLEVAV